MVTGKESKSHLSATCLSGFMNQFFDSEATARYTLFLFIGPNQIAGLVKSDHDRILATEYYQVSLSDDKLLKKVFSQSEAFNHFFKEVVVHVCLPDVVLTPLDWIESYEDENLLHHGAGKQDAKKVLTHLDSKNKWIYSVPNPLFQLIISTYKNVQWSPALASKRNIPTEGLFLLTFDEQLLLFDHSTGNKLASWSAYDRPESALFAVLTYCEIENIAPSEITIQLVSQESEDLMSILAPYVNVIQPFDSVTDDAVQDTYLINFLNQISYARN